MELRDFFSVIADDPRITVTHISLYLALLSEWKEQDCPEWICVERSKLMSMAKINGRSTYDKCIHDLHAFRYITYEPTRAKGKSRLEIRRLG
ncbi:MAG: hypothetical protein V4450_17725 [Bacteroidota bacterium]